MKKRFLKSMFSILMSVSIILGTICFCFALKLDAVAENENYVPLTEIKNAAASSFQPGYDAWKAFDGIENDPNNCWHTPWGADMTGFPHWIMAEFESAQTIDALIYIPRDKNEYQFVTDYEVWISTDKNEDNLQKVVEGTWERGEWGLCEIPAQEAVLVKFVILDKTDANNNPEDLSVSASEIKFRLDSEVKMDNYVPNTEIKAATASSFQPGYDAWKAFDGTENDPGNCWHTPWGEDMRGFPHWLMAEFKETQIIDSLVYIPRSRDGYQFVTEYEVWISPDKNEENLKKAGEGTWVRGGRGICEFPAQEAVLVKFIILNKTDANNDPEDLSVSASEIKFRLNDDVPGAYNSAVLKTSARADNVLSYTKSKIGTGTYQFDKARYDGLNTENEVLKLLLNTIDSKLILAQIQKVEEAILCLLGSNKTQEENLVMEIPKTMMSVSANSANPGYAPEKAIDGNVDTIWHSEWTPENDPFPHIITVDLQQTMLLEKISITPRQDMDTGKITKGQIYAGDNLDDMKHVTDFSGVPGKSATVVDLDFATARYIQIYSLASTSVNTAISEIGISTFDRGIAGAFLIYDGAVDLLRKANSGTGIGEYSSKDIDKFKEKAEAFGDMLHKESLSTEEYYAISEKIRSACEEFLQKSRVYTKADLSALIKRLEDLMDGIKSAEDKASTAAILESANTVFSDGDAAREEIHNMANQLIDFMKSIEAQGNGACDLSGEWKLFIGDYSGGDMQLSQKVMLPGTLDTNKIGTYNSYDDINKLSRYYTYSGPATYQKNVYVNKEWADKSIQLYMERSRETRVWVNGTEIKSPETSNILPVSQSYNISKNLRFGEYNTITIVVDNSYPNLPKTPVGGSHMATDETQTNWNGIVGKFELKINDNVFIDDARVYPNKDLKSVTVQADVKNNADSAYTGTLALRCASANERNINVSLAAGESKTVTVSDYAMPADVKLWSEFDTPLYEMTARLDGGDVVKRTFGMRVFSKGSDKKSFTINGDKVFLRSEANCAVFPMTGYAPMDEAGWEKLFTAYQSYGINSVRFHSWCPPEAAFNVADRLGMYLQPELSCWDAGMFDNDVKKTYYTKEAFAILKEYANHPSFVMFSFGNELQYQGNNYQYADQLIGKLKEADSTRLYAPGSNVSFSSANPTPNTDFYTAQAFWGTPMRGSYGGMGGFINQEYPSSNVNYDDAVKRISAFGVPSFSFEVGQFQVFPDMLTEAPKYTGVLDARNFKMIAERVKEKGISEAEVTDTINASGMLSRIGYKAEIEAALRTRDLSGISLLGIQDFSGQGTALVGMMNAFGESKPYDFADPDEFSKFFNPTVVLFETEKFCYKNSEQLTGNLLFSNYSQDDLAGEIRYKLTAMNGTKVAEGKTKSAPFAQGELTSAGKISIALDGVKEPTQLRLEISCLETSNSYNIWVYPDKEAASDGEVYVTEYLDETASEILAEGGKVFLSPKSAKSALPESVTGSFTTAFWSSGFTSESQPGTMGLLLEPEHPLFSAFPTEYYTDYQWWSMSKHGRPMNLENLKDKDGKKIQPLVKVLDGFANLNNMGLLYEASVGNGKIVVSSMGLEQLKYEYPEAGALRDAIIGYMNSDDFSPEFEVDEETIKAQVLKVPGDERKNLASKYSGGKPFTAGKTVTCQGGYDRDPIDRLTEINDGIVDLTSPSRSWTDYRGDQIYDYDVEIGVKLAEDYTIDSVAFSFFEDPGCKAPKTVTVKYWNGEAYVPVTNQDMVSGFIPSMNTIYFDPVNTGKLLFVMERHDGMAIAISEMFVYEKQVNPDRIIVKSQDNKDKIQLTETLQMYIGTDPAYANNTLVRWSVLDQSGKPSALAKIGFDGVLRPIAKGKVIIRAELRSDPNINATKEIRIVDQNDTSSGETSSSETSSVTSSGSSSITSSNVSGMSSGTPSDISGTTQNSSVNAEESEQGMSSGGARSPKTGSAGVPAAVILMMITGGAVLVTKKNKKR